ncbi:hypothetical protein P7K49_008699, partial [Saguinus oedipus]
HSRLPVLGFTPDVHTPTRYLRTKHLLLANCNYSRKSRRDSWVAESFAGTGVPSF